MSNSWHDVDIPVFLFIYFFNNEKADLFEEKWRAWTEIRGLDGGGLLNGKWIDVMPQWRAH